MKPDQECPRCSSTNIALARDMKGAHRCCECFTIWVPKEFQTKESKLDHRFRDDNFQCPHCGYLHSDCFEWPAEGEDSCPECHGKFTFRKDTVYSTEKMK